MKALANYILKYNIFILIFTFSSTILMSQNGSSHLYFYRSAKAFTNNVKFEIFLNEVKVGKLTNNSKVLCKLNTGGKVKINLSAYISRSREQDLDISRTMFITEGTDYYFSLNYDEIWQLRDIKKNVAVAKFTACKHETYFEESPNQLITGVNKGFLKPQDKSKPSIYFDIEDLNKSNKYTSNQEKLILSGKINDNSEITKFHINNNLYTLDNDNKFSVEINLIEGINIVNIQATDKFNNIGVKTIELNYTNNNAVVVINNPNIILNSSMIKWESPTKTSFSTSRDKLEIKACISLKSGIDKVNLIVNSKLHKSFYYESNNTTSNCRLLINEKVPLGFGNNIISLKCFSDKKTIESKKIVSYKPPSYNYHALIIGVEDYTDEQISDLSNPVADAKKLRDLLSSKYTFAEDNIRLLINPSKAEIIGTLHKMRSSIGDNDNLLIFYAGHGYWDDDMKVGYWLPSDATMGNPVNWLPNTDLTNYINAIRTKHTLLIADACFSGSIFKTRKAFNKLEAIERLYKLPSRKAMTSGTLKEVPDQSVFIKYLLKRLGLNDKEFLSSEQLFSSMRMAILNNTANIPQFGTIKNTGDEGGDFIFIKK